MKASSSISVVASIEHACIYITEPTSPHTCDVLCKLSLPDALSLLESLNQATDKLLEHIES